VIDQEAKMASQIQQTPVEERRKAGVGAGVRDGLEWKADEEDFGGFSRSKFKVQKVPTR